MRHRRGTDLVMLDTSSGMSPAKTDIDPGNSETEWGSRAVPAREAPHLKMGNENGYLYNVPSFALVPAMIPKITPTSQVAT